MRLKNQLNPKTKLNWVNHIIGTHWITPVSSKSPSHSGGNDRFCARLKTDISASNSGLRGRTRSCLTFLERGRRDESKMVKHDLRWPWRPELKAEMSVFNLAQKRSFPPLCKLAHADIYMLITKKPLKMPYWGDSQIKKRFFLATLLLNSELTKCGEKFHYSTAKQMLYVQKN
jgi:hypothetical protein